jgi:hypothetical protein
MEVPRLEFYPGVFPGSSGKFIRIERACRGIYGVISNALDPAIVEHYFI